MKDLGEWLTKASLDWLKTEGRPGVFLVREYRECFVWSFHFLIVGERSREDEFPDGTSPVLHWDLIMNPHGRLQVREEEWSRPGPFPEPWRISWFPFLEDEGEGSPQGPSSRTISPSKNWEVCSKTLSGTVSWWRQRQQLHQDVSHPVWGCR